MTNSSKRVLRLVIFKEIFFFNGSVGYFPSTKKKSQTVDIVQSESSFMTSLHDD